VGFGQEVAGEDTNKLVPVFFPIQAVFKEDLEGS
jgi:hypothetical protein